MSSADFRAVIKNTSTFVKFVCLAITLGYILSFSTDSVKVLSVTPGYLIPPQFWIWTLFTFWTLEIHFLSFLADILTVLFCGKLIEPLWGSLEMWKFFAIVNTFVAILSSFYSLFYAMITQNSEHLFHVHIFGLSGYIAAVAVAVRQILPDHLIVKTPLGRFTNRSVPLTALLLTIVLWSLGLMNGQTPVMFGSGIVVSWIYLRFYQRHHSHGSRGDGADNFTFASFFPNVLQPGINCFSNPIYQFSLRIGLVQKFSPPRTSEQNLTSVNVSYPHDQERRRQIALKALNERLSKTGGNAVGPLHHHHHDSSRHQQHLLPKSFPTMMNQHGFFVPPAIPLPPPPSMAGTSTTSSSTTPQVVTGVAASSAVPAATAAAAADPSNTTSSSLTSSSSSAVFVDSQILIDIESDTQK